MCDYVFNEFKQNRQNKKYKNWVSGNIKMGILKWRTGKNLAIFLAN